MTCMATQASELSGIALQSRTLYSKLHVLSSIQSPSNVCFLLIEFLIRLVIRPHCIPSCLKVLKYNLEAQVDEEEVKEFGKRHLPKYQVPHRVIVLDEIPRNPMGKINKKALKRELDL